MRFSEYFRVAATGVEWFDPVLTEDTPLYVDPFLVYEETNNSWADCHDSVVQFFAGALELVRRSAGDESSVHWTKAERLLTFPEPKEFALGMSMGSPFGSGTGSEFAHSMAQALGVVSRGGITEVSFVELFSLFTSGLGVDRISDILCNILKFKFIAYTQSVATTFGIPMNRVATRHIRWSSVSRRWEDGDCLLPVSP
jgi:hypothetical protein